MKPRVFISRICCSLGRHTGLEELQREGVPKDIIEGLRKRGFAGYLQFEGNWRETRTSCIADLLDSFGAGRPEIKTVLVVDERADHSLATPLLGELGLSDNVWVVGVGLQQCAGSGAALRLASGIISADDHPGAVLVVISSVAIGELGRVGKKGDILFSDGVVAFLVSQAEGPVELLAVECRTYPWPDEDMQPTFDGEYLRCSHERLRSTINTALRRASLGPKQISRVFCTNAGLFSHYIIASAAGLPREVVYSNSFRTLGHVLACDEMIGLSRHLSDVPNGSDDYFLLVAWGPATMSAGVVRTGPWRT